MLIGYARVSTGEQTTAAQVAALKTSGCELIFRDNASGGRWDRPELHKLLSQLRKGDVLVVWTLDRLSRSLRDVLTIMERVQERHAGFRSLKEAVDTTTPAGRMMMQMVGAFAEFERAMLKERTKAGLDAARKERPDRRPAAEAQAPPATGNCDAPSSRGRRPPPTRRACSASTRQRCRGYSGGPRSSLLPYFRFHCSPSPMTADCPPRPPRDHRDTLRA